MRNQGGQLGTAGMAGRGGYRAHGGAGRSGGKFRRDNLVKLIRHELNTPLATALLYLGIAEGSAAEIPKGVVHSALRVARAEVQRLKTLLDTVTELECVGMRRLGHDQSTSGRPFGRPFNEWLPFAMQRKFGS